MMSFMLAMHSVLVCLDPALLDSACAHACSVKRGGAPVGGLRSEAGAKGALDKDKK